VAPWEANTSGRCEWVPQIDQALMECDALSDLEYYSCAISFANRCWRNDVVTGDLRWLLGQEPRAMDEETAEWATDQTLMCNLIQTGRYICQYSECVRGIRM
jgi:hypothetical protein